jgi:tRNA A-37 threonylcarbamoyl transferase component Bud32
MAQVYRAYHSQLDRYVAIKVLRSELVSDASFLARFQREAQAVAALRHPHVIQVYDFDIQDDAYYMVMELLEGDTLKSRLHDHRARDEQMPIGDIVRILCDVLDGLSYAHGEGVVHRDIKPANILLTKRGEAVLADFGIAQIVGGTRHTAAGALMGTLSYMAPEQGLEGKSDVRSDIYSLGVVMYEMLTLRTPFDAETPLAVLLKHLNDPVPLPHEFDLPVPPAVEQVAIRALEKEPENRFQSAQEMYVALCEAAATAEIDVPTQISVPTSLATGREVVFSGEDRVRLAPDNVVTLNTDFGLEESRALVRIDGDRLLGNKAGETGGVGKAIVRAVGLFVIGNMAAVTVTALSDRWPVFLTGWPVELLLASLSLCIVMTATACIWLLIPIGILIGNGLALSYSSLTGNWQHWQYLWPLELWYTLLLVGVTLWLFRSRDRAHRLSRWLGRALGWVAFTWSLLVAAAAIVA